MSVIAETLANVLEDEIANLRGEVSDSAAALFEVMKEANLHMNEVVGDVAAELRRTGQDALVSTIMTAFLTQQVATLAFVDAVRPGARA